MRVTFRRFSAFSLSQGGGLLRLLGGMYRIRVMLKISINGGDNMNPRAMNESNLFRILVAERRWQQYETFKLKFETAAGELAVKEKDPKLARVSVSERQFWRWLYGNVKNLPRPDACRVLEHMFSCRAEELFSPARSTEQARHMLSRAIPPSVHGTQYEQVDHRTEEDIIMAAARESARFAQSVEQTNVGPHTLEQFEADIKRIVKTYPNRPILPLFLEVRELRDRAFELLEGRQPPQRTQDLYVIAGVLCGILANASFDLGHFAEAETQARTAFLCAELAGHNGLRAWIRGTQSLIAYWDDRPLDAIELARSGWEYVPESGTARVRLASIEARAQARLQRHDDAIAALQRAEEAREQVRADDEPGGMMAFPMAKQLFYASTAELWLGGAKHCQQAERNASQAVALYEGAPPEDRRVGELCLARLDLAAARLGQDDLEGAAHHIRAVFATSSRRRTESVARRLRQLGNRLELSRYHRVPLAQNVRDEIVAFTTIPVAALPQGMNG